MTQFNKLLSVDQEIIIKIISSFSHWHCDPVHRSNFDYRYGSTKFSLVLTLAEVVIVGEHKFAFTLPSLSGWFDSRNNSSSIFIK